MATGAELAASGADIPVNFDTGATPRASPSGAGSAGQRGEFTPDIRGVPPSKMELGDATHVLKMWYYADAEHSRLWRDNAKQDFDFYAGDQWTPEDLAKLNAQKRPAITLNQVLVVIKAVCGFQINARRKIAYLPRGGTAGPQGLIKVQVNETLTGASTWMADEADADMEQTSAFEDMLICGMGWTEPGIAYDDFNSPDGKYREPKVDPIEMVWDKNARSKNLVDAKRMFRVRRVSMSEAMGRFPGKMPEDLDASWADLDDIEKGKSIEERRMKIENSEGSYEDPEAMVTLVHAQWIELEPYHRIIDPVSGKATNVSREDFEKISKVAKEGGVNLIATPMRRRVFKQAWIGREILSEINECSAKDRFSWHCLTGERHRNKGTFFGLIRLMRDPQLWVNKLFSQTLHIMNSAAKGGVMAEEDAFEDVDDAQETYAAADAITFVRPGAISGNKIIAKPGAGNPGGYVNLLEYAEQVIRKATGINVEALGSADRNQPIGLEQIRKASVMSILATLFDSLTGFQKNVGRTRLTFIQDYLSNGQLIRLTGPEGYKLIPLTRDKTVGLYEVIVDSAPSSPNEEKETWEAIESIFPIIGPRLDAEGLSLIMDFMPIPAQLRASFKELLSKPNPQADQQTQLALQSALANIANAKAQAARATAQAGNEHTKALQNLSNISAQEAEAAMDHAKAELLARMFPNRHQLPAIMPKTIPHMPSPTMSAPVNPGAFAPPLALPPTA